MFALCYGLYYHYEQSKQSFFDTNARTWVAGWQRINCAAATKHGKTTNHGKRLLVDRHQVPASLIPTSMSLKKCCDWTLRETWLHMFIYINIYILTYTLINRCDGGEELESLMAPTFSSGVALSPHPLEGTASAGTRPSTSPAFRSEWDADALAGLYKVPFGMALLLLLVLLLVVIMVWFFVIILIVRNSHVFTFFMLLKAMMLVL